MCPQDEADFVDYWGSSVIPQLVNWNGKCWRHKPGDGWREILAYELGSSWLNVAEAISPVGIVGATRCDGTAVDPSADPSSALVRLIQDQFVGGFVEPDHDRAMAAELAFSLWIRRRDAHSWNRAYVAGIPGFFDQHVAFGAEVANRSLDGFFRHGVDAGFASQWRVRSFPDGFQPTTRSERGLHSRELAIHRVHNVSAFDGYLDLSVQKIRQFGRAEIEALVARSGAPEPDEVTGFLLRWADELPEAVRRLRSIVMQHD
jgi:hypothetical protein